MNRKQFLILLALMILLGAAGRLIYKKQNASWAGGGAGVGLKLLGDFPVNDVAAIVVKSGTNEMDLVKKGGLWRVAQRNDYPANYSDISSFLLKAADLKATQIEEIGPSQLGRLMLLPPGPGTNTGVLVEFRDAGGKAIQSLLLGKPHLHKADRRSPAAEGADESWPDGRYVMAGTGAKTEAVISDPLGNMDVKPELWLSKDFFKVEKIRSIAVDYPEVTNSWKLTRESESGEWKLSDPGSGEQLDTAKASSVASPLASPTFADVVSGSNTVETGLDNPISVRLETFDDFTYALKIGRKTNDNYYFTVAVNASLPRERAPGKDEKPEEKEKRDKEFKAQTGKIEGKLAREKGFEKWTYLVSTWTFDSLLKKRSELLVEKKEESKKDEPPPEVKEGS